MLLNKAVQQVATLVNDEENSPYLLLNSQIYMMKENLEDNMRKRYCGEVVLGADAPSLPSQSTTPNNNPSNNSGTANNGNTPTSNGNTPTSNGNTPTSNGNVPTSNGNVPTNNGGNTSNNNPVITATTTSDPQFDALIGDIMQNMGDLMANAGLGGGNNGSN